MLEKAHFKKQILDEQLHGAKWEQVITVSGHERFYWEDKSILKLIYGDGCTL